MKKCLFLIIACIILAFSTNAKTLYVDGASGNDATTYAANGPSAPWRTIGRAAWGSTNRGSPNSAQAAQAGDIVIVSAGIYTTVGSGDRFNPAYNPINSGTLGNPITFQASGPVILTLSSGAGPMIGSYGLAAGGPKNYITWRGFTIDEANALSLPDTGPVVIAYSNGSIIENNTIIGVLGKQRSDNYNGIRLEVTKDVTIRNNRIYNFQGSFGRNHAAIMTYDSSRLIIENNEISGVRTGDVLNSGSGIHIKGFKNNSLPTYSWLEIRNNLIYDIEGSGIEIHLSPNYPQTPNRIHNNIIKDSLVGVRLHVFDVGAWDPRNAKIVNNDVINTGIGLDVTGSLVDNAGHVFWNNILVNSNKGMEYTAPVGSSNFAESRLDRQHNLYYIFSRFATVEGVNYNTMPEFMAAFAWSDSSSPVTTAADPLFVNPSQDDYRLQAGSPARTLGVDYLDLDNDGSTTDIIPAGAYITGNEVIGRTTGTTAPGPDTTPPVRLNGAPSGTLASGTTQTTLSLSTNEAATCRYSTTANTAFSSMANAFLTTGSTSHSQLITGLTNGQTYNYYVRCQDTAAVPNSNANDYAIIFSVLAPDSVPPTAAITAPASGAIVSDTITITASASDNIGVIGVQFIIDGANAETEDTSSPYSISWNSRTVQNGTHTITATARDAAGNIATSDPVTVNVQNAPVIMTETVWFDDNLPPAADPASVNDIWNWISSNPAPYSGTLAHQSNIFAGLHHHNFIDADIFNIGTGEIIFTYVYIDPANPPIEIMLSFQDSRRLRGYAAYWGANLINEGTDGTNSRRYMGPLPPAGQWIRLEIPASQVGLENLGIKGVHFMLYDGKATWDRFGKSTIPVDTSPPIISNGAPSGNLAAGTTQTTILLSTNEAATCRYSTTANTDYSSMAGTFTTTGLTTHSTTITGLSDGQAYNYYVRCIDSSSNSNAVDYEISFSVSSTALEGDINNDGTVNMQDIMMIVNDFGKTSGFNPAVDVGLPLNSIDLFDVMIVVRNWGRIG